AYDWRKPFERVFTDKSIGADTWQWNFGDGTSSTTPIPIHTYGATGTYTAMLTVTNASTGCSYTSQETFSIVDDKADFAVSDSVVCKGISVNFTTVNINSANIASYYWDFGDGTFITSIIV